MRRRKDQSDEVVAFRAAKTAAGGSGCGPGGGSHSGYKPGQKVACRILQALPGGYRILVPGVNLLGYLPSTVSYKVGIEIQATYICTDKDTVLVTELFAGGEGDWMTRDHSIIEISRPTRTVED